MREMLYEEWAGWLMLKTSVWLPGCATGGDAAMARGGGNSSLAINGGYASVARGGGDTAAANMGDGGESAAAGVGRGLLPRLPQ